MSTRSEVFLLNFQKYEALSTYNTLSGVLQCIEYHLLVICVTTGGLNTLMKCPYKDMTVFFFVFFKLTCKVRSFQAKLQFLSVSSKLSCWSNRGSISWGTIRHPWKRPVCLWPSQAIGPCPEHNHPRPLRPFPLWCRNLQPNRALPPVSHWIRCSK